MKKEKTSLEKSHSIFSNFKLTLMCLLATISLNGLVITLALASSLEKGVSLLLFIAFGSLTVLSLLLFSIFKR